MKDNHKPGTYLSYLNGFLISIFLTAAAYVPVHRHIDSSHEAYTHRSITIFVIILAVVQMLVQLFFFLHLGRENKPRWRAVAVVFALMVVLIIVVGSLWIMDNLNYRMTPHQQSIYLKNQDGGI